jgi:hypothetical protein
MGFHVRYITKEIILRTSNIHRLFNADAFNMDSWSGKFYELYKKGYDKDIILKLLDKTFDKDIKNN